MVELISKLVVVGASNLPATERLSKIDPYVVLRIGDQTFKTSAIDNSDHPVWNQAFRVILEKSEINFKGSMIIELYDENTIKDTLVCKTTVDLSGKAPQDLYQMVIPLEPVKDKYKEEGLGPSITLHFQGFMQSYVSLRNMFSAHPGFKCNDQEGRLYIPIAESDGLLYLGVEYEADLKVDFKVFVTRPHQPIYVDLSISGSSRTKLRRRTYNGGFTILPGLTVYEELKLDDVPLYADFNHILIHLFDSESIGATSAATIVSAHGWVGSLSFEEAAKKLHNVLIDYKEQEIYMTVDEKHSMLVVDFDKNNVDIKLAVLETPSTTDKGYALSVKGKDHKNETDLFTPPVARMGNQLMISRMFQLDDLEYGTALDDIQIKRYKLKNHRSFPVQAVSRIMG